MPRPRKSPEQREQTRRETVQQYNASGKGRAARQRYRVKLRAERLRALAEQQSREIRDDSGKLIAYRLPNGTIQAL